MPATFSTTCDGDCDDCTTVVHHRGGGCGDPCIVDENGVALPAVYDPDGNLCYQAVVGTPLRKVVSYTGNSVDLADVDCCDSDADIGNIAYDTDAGCVTGMCGGSGLGWLPVCAAPSAPPAERVCYDLTGWTFPATYGGGSGSWLVAGVNQLAGIDCENPPIGADPQTVEFTCDHSQSWCGNMILADPATLSWTDTGQGAGAATVIEATGNLVDGWACSRPTFRVDFGLPPGSAGPYTLNFTLEDTGGCINFAVWDRCNGTFLPMVSFTGPGGSIDPTPGGMGGDLFTVNTNGIPVPAGFSITLADPNLVDGSCLELIITAMGATSDASNPIPNDPDDNERVTGTILTHTPPPLGAPDCCETWATPAALAAYMSGIDPTGAVWSVDGASVCATVDPGQGQLYGLIESCDDNAAATWVPVT